MKTLKCVLFLIVQTKTTLCVHEFAVFNCPAEKIELKTSNRKEEV